MEITLCMKKDVGMGLFVQCFYTQSLHLVSVSFLLYNSTPYRRVLFYLKKNKQTCDHRQLLLCHGLGVCIGYSMCLRAM